MATTAQTTNSNAHDPRERELRKGYIRQIMTSVVSRSYMSRKLLFPRSRNLRARCYSSFYLDDNCWYLLDILVVVALPLFSIGLPKEEKNSARAREGNRNKDGRINAVARI